jgi:phage gp29-like protein
MAKVKQTNQTQQAQKPVKRVPGGGNMSGKPASMVTNQDRNFQFNPSQDAAYERDLTSPFPNRNSPTFDNGINMVKGPPIADIAVPPPQPSLDDVLTEWGGTGTIIVGGILSNVDYNDELTGTQRVLVYDQMRKGDSTVRAALLAVKLPILAANWYIKAFDQSPAQQDIKNFVDEQLFHTMDITWNDWLRHCMNYLDYGSMVFEKVFQQGDNGMIGWEKFAPRLTKTIYRWRMPDNVTEGITQILPTGGLRGIPLWKVMVFVNEQEGENYEGISLLRAAHQPWYFKTSLYKIDAIATERQGLGVPYVKIPPNASDPDRAKIDELMRNLRANEQANIQVPVGWEIGYMDTKGSAVKTAKDMIMHYDRQISKSVLAQFMELGSGSVGSFALSSDQSQLFLLSLKAIATQMQDTLNNDAVREIVDLNYQISANQYPTLEFGRIGNVDVEKLSTALFRLAQGGLLSASPELEEYLKNVLDLPAGASTSEDDTTDPDDSALPVPVVPKVAKPVSVTAKEQIKLENKLHSELKEVSRHIGMDVREMKRNISDIIYAKKH